MKFLKEPVKKEKNPLIPWEQREFTALYRDIPASECPNSGVTKARNGLLFGDRYRIRPGTKQWSEEVCRLVNQDNFLVDLWSDNKEISSHTRPWSAGDGSPYVNYAIGDQKWELILNSNDIAIRQPIRSELVPWTMEFDVVPWEVCTFSPTIRQNWPLNPIGPTLEQQAIGTLRLNDWASAFGAWDGITFSSFQQFDTVHIKLEVKDIVTNPNDLGNTSCQMQATATIVRTGESYASGFVEVEADVTSVADFPNYMKPMFVMDDTYTTTIGFRVYDITYDFGSISEIVCDDDALPTLEEEPAIVSSGGTLLSPLPSLTGRDDYIAIKEGYIITKTQGEDFTQDDLGSFFVWPDGTHDLIVDVLDKDRIRVYFDTAHAPATADDLARMRGRLNQIWVYRKTKQVFIHIDTRVFYTDYTMSNYTEVWNHSGNRPSNERSNMDDYKDEVYLFTSNGHFKVDTRSNPLLMVQINTENPDNSIHILTESTGGAYPYNASETWKRYATFGRRYLFSMSKLTGVGNRNRLSSRIIKETGVNNPRATEEYHDWKSAYFMFQYKDVENTRGRFGFPLLLQTSIILDNIHLWTEEGSASFTIEVDNGLSTETREIVCDFTGVDIVTFHDIADEIQIQLRATWSEWNYISCFFDSDSGMFVFHMGELTVGKKPSITGIGNGTTGVNLLQSDYLGLSTTIGSIHGWSLLGTNAEPALKIPEGQQGWTHFTVYSTVELQQTVVNNRLTSPVNPEQYIWQQDVPVAKAFYGQLLPDGDTGLFTDVLLTQGEVELMDAGCMVRIGGYGLFLIDTVYSSTYFRIYTEMPVGGFFSMSIGRGEVGQCERVNNTITLMSGRDFRADDIDKLIYWSDGSTSHITAYIDKDSVYVAETYVEIENLSMTMDPIGRNYNDALLDDVLIQRARDFDLRQRLKEPLPNTNLGVIVPGFIAVAQEDDTIFYYSDLSENEEYLGGHHNLEFQKNTVKDAITSLREMPNQMIIFCKNSTYRTQINVTDTVTIPGPEILVDLMSGLGVVDKSIGAMHDTAIADVGDGVFAVITSEPEIRFFNGYQFSEGKTVDKLGRGHIKGDLQKLRPLFAMGYDPNLYGLMVWGTEETRVALDRVGLTEKCWRLATKPEHGFNFSELFGDDWVFPEIGINSLQLYTEDNLAVTVVMDAVSGLPWMLCTRKGPKDGPIKIIYKDKQAGSSYIGGGEIPWEMMYKEHTGTEEKYLIQHYESHNYFRPENEANKGKSGYDDNGFRNAQQIDIKVYEDGEIVETSETKDLPNNGDIAFTKQIEARRIQLEVIGSASEIQCVSHKTKYELLLNRSAPSLREINEAQVEESLSLPLFWLTRGRYMGQNLADGTEPISGSIGMKYIGPDDVEDSAFDLMNGAISYNLIDPLDGDFSIIFGIKGMVSLQNIINIGDLYISLEESPEGWNIRYADSSGIYSFPIDNHDNWRLFSIGRTSNRLIIFENGAKLSESVLSSVHTATGNIIVGASNPSVMYGYDFRVYPAYKDEQVMEFYNRDITEQEGVALLPA